MTQSGTSTFSVAYDGNNHINATGIGYDAAGNLTSFNNGVFTNTYAYDAEGRLSNVNNGAATYIRIRAVNTVIDSTLRATTNFSLTTDPKDTVSATASPTVENVSGAKFSDQ
jgi:YD repeat-containing protein